MGIDEMDLMAACAGRWCEYVETWAAILKTEFERMSAKDKEKISAKRALHELPHEELPELAVHMACTADHMQSFATAINFAQSKKPGVILQIFAY